MQSKSAVIKIRSIYEKLKNEWEQMIFLCLNIDESLKSQWNM